MIHELTGDLLLSKSEVLVHGLAPDDDCKQGLARALRERFPAMYKDFRHWCRIAGPKPGSMWSWQGVDANGKTVHLIALLTQEPPDHAGAHPGRATTASVNHALHELRKWIDREKPRSIAMPAIATGVGGDLGIKWRRCCRRSSAARRRRFTSTHATHRASRRPSRLW